MKKTKSKDKEKKKENTGGQSSEKKLNRKERRKLKREQKKEQMKKEAQENGIDEQSVGKNETEEHKLFKFSIPLPTKESYKKVSEERFEGVLRLSQSDGWEELPKFEKKGIKAYKKHDEKTNIFYIKATGTNIRCSANTLLQWLYDPKNINDTDPMFKSGEVVEKFDDDAMIYFGQWSLPWPMWHRDFVYLWTKTWKKDGTGVAAAVSVVHPKFPENEGKSKGHVRGEILETGCIVRDIGKPEDKKSEFTYIICANPRGWIPNFIINSVAGDQALNVYRAIKYWNENEDTNPKAPPIPN